MNTPPGALAPAPTNGWQSAAREAKQAATNAALESPWLFFLCLNLLGYALLSKGWAYVGRPPIFVGEITLGLGLLAVFFFGRWDNLLALSPNRWLLALLSWTALQTVAYLPKFGLDAIRDAMLLGYGTFAIILFSYLTAKPGRLVALVSWYDRFTWLFLLGIPLAWTLSMYFNHLIPTWPWADVPIVDVKGGDVLVHLSCILAFFVSGLGTAATWWQVSLLTGCIGMAATYNRGGLVALGGTAVTCWYHQPSDKTLRRMAVIALSGLIILLAVDFRFPSQSKGRVLSAEQLLINVVSIAGEADDGDLEGTKQWRLNWWRKIWNYTVDGKYFWTGKGFGINLADADGFQGQQWEGKLRSPHNGHMTVLARTGVPGFLLWLAFLGTWLRSVVTSYFDSLRKHNVRWSALFFFLLASWVAFVINASFDVFLEGPMGGIWFWTIIGVGLSAVWIYARYPDVWGEARRVV